MNRDTVAMLMVEELDRVRTSGLCRAFGWDIDVDGLATYVWLRPRKRKDLAFLLRATFEDFPNRAPSCIFVDEQTRSMDDGAWPRGVRHGGEPPGICTLGTREFHEHYHANERQYAWEPDRYTFIQTLAEIHRLMERGIGN